MSGEYYCAHCEREFVVEEGGKDRGDRPPCPKCGQTESVQSADTFALVGDIRRQWFVVFAILFLAGAGYVLYQWTNGG
jgi:transposase-like protein